VTSLNYEHGLARLIDDNGIDANAKNRVLQISVSFMFGSAN
jgi:hypothetical protein